MVTLRRPAFVDGPLLEEARAAHLSPEGANDRLRLIEPIPYLEFRGLVEGAAGVIADSGEIQEEAAFLGIQCFTLRANTERPVTCDIGTNTLLGLSPARIVGVPGRLAKAAGRQAAVHDPSDRAAAGRVVDVLAGAARNGWTPAAPKV